jgi:tetratricopeptide (TPR) repeat protein
MSDALPQNEIENQTDSQTGEPNGLAGLAHAETEAKEIVEETTTPSEARPFADESSKLAESEVAENASVEPVEEPEYETKKRAPFAAMKVLFVILIVSVFGFACFGLETEYTSRHWLKTIVTGGGLLPKVFSGSSSVALRAAADTLHGNFESTKGNFAEAQKAYERALVAYDVLDSVDTVCGHFCVIGLGRAQNELKQEEEAQKNLKRAIEAAKVVYGKDHETVAIGSRELAYAYAKQKNYSEAETYYRDALNLDTKGMGPDNFDVAYDMSCMAEMMLLQKKYADAIKYLSDSIVIYKKARGDYHPSFLWVEEGLGKAYYESKAYAQAARQFEGVLATTDRLHGTPGKDYFRDLAWLGWSYYHDLNLERARLRAKKLKVLLDEKSAADLNSMLDVVESNGDLFMMLGDHANAIDQFERLLVLQEAKLGKNDPQLRSVLLYLAQCYEKSGKPDQAKHYSARAEEVIDRQY